MKKLVFLLFVFSVFQVSGQDLKSLSKSVSASGSSMIEGLAADQVKSLTKKLMGSIVDDKQMKTMETYIPK
jgi:hypothetical protein